MKCYQMADLILTPTEYSKSLLNGYGIKNPIEVISNGVDTCEFQKNVLDRESFSKKIWISQRGQDCNVGWAVL